MTNTEIIVSDAIPDYWAFFDAWCDLHREVHPSDYREDLELIDEYFADKDKLCDKLNPDDYILKW